MTRVVALAALALAACNPFQGEEPRVKDAIADYEASKFADAEQKFDEALRTDPSSEAHLGKGASLYSQNKFADAAEEQTRATGAEEPGLRSRAYLDLGNTAAKGGKLDEAIAAYRRALEVKPDDHDARYNLEWALGAKKKAEDQKKDPDKDGGDKKDDKKDQKQDQQAKNDENGQKKDEQQQEQKTPSDQQKQDDQQKKDGKQGDQKDQQQQEQQAKDGKPKDDEQGKPDDQQGQQEEQAKNGDEKKDAEQQGAAGQGDGKEEQGQPDAAPVAKNDDKGDKPKAMTRQDAAQVLDAMQAGEKPFQLWKFQRQGKREERSNADKDW